MLYISLDSSRSCSSASRITARLLFSFLALSPLSVVTASPDPIPLRATALPDIFGPGPVIGGGEGASGGEGGQTFVDIPELHRVTLSLGKLGAYTQCTDSSSHTSPRRQSVRFLSSGIDLE